MILLLISTLISTLILSVSSSNGLDTHSRTEGVFLLHETKTASNVIPGSLFSAQEYLQKEPHFISPPHHAEFCHVDVIPTLMATTRLLKLLTILPCNGSDIIISKSRV